MVVIKKTLPIGFIQSEDDDGRFNESTIIVYEF